MTCPVCGEKDGACHGDSPVRLTADQLIDIGLKPEQLKPGGTITMADQDEPKGRYPKQEVSPGQKHGYIGDVEVYEPAHNEAGYSNAGDDSPPSSSSSSSSKGKTTRTKQSAADATPAETAIVGSTGTIGGSVDHVSAPKP